MADWVYPTLPTTDTPITAEWGAAVQANPVALAEAASGAPRIRPGTMGVLAAGAQVRVSYPDTFSIPAGWAAQFTVSQSGSIRVGLQHQGALNAGIVVSRHRLFADDVVLASWTNSGSWVDRSIDVSVNIGDVVSISKPTEGITSIRNVTISTSGGYIWPNGFNVVAS